MTFKVIDKKTGKEPTEIEDCHYCKYVLCSGVDDENPVCHLGDEDEDYYSHQITDSKQAEHCMDFIFCEPFQKGEIE